jgi:pilus assembly protein CpaC
MYRKIAGGFVWLSLMAGLATAQPVLPKPKDDAPGGKRIGAVMIPQGSSQKLSMTTKKPITFIQLDRDGIIRVVPDAQDRSAVILSGLQPGTVQLTLTDDAKAQELYEIVVQVDVAQLRTILAQAIPTANVEVIPATNRAVLLKGWAARAEDVDTIIRVANSVLGQGAQVINAIQVGGVHQVQLDVTVASVNRSEARRRGYSFSVNSGGFSFGSILAGLTASSAATTTGGGGGGVGVISSPARLQPLQPPTGANVVFGLVASNFQSLLQALKDEQLAKLLAEPKLVAMSGRPARFLSGGQQAVLSAQGSIGGPGVDFRDTGTELEFLPIVLGNGRIYLEVSPRVRNVNQTLGINTSFGFVPGFDEQSVRTAIEMEPGQTFAIGGLIQTTVQSSASRIPVLGELPIIGGLFNTVQHTENEQEVIILVTPHLVDAMDCNQAPKKLPGRETRSPDDYELFLEYLLEAPRGQRQPWENGRYKPAYKNDPSSQQYPCSEPNPRGGLRRNANCAPGTTASTATIPNAVVTTSPSLPTMAPPSGQTTEITKAPVVENRAPAMPPPPDLLPRLIGTTGEPTLPEPIIDQKPSGRVLVIPGMPSPPQ